MSQHREQPLWHSEEVHQAEGMLMVRLHITIDEAVDALREHAARTDRALGDAARDVIRGSSTSRGNRGL